MKKYIFSLFIFLFAGPVSAFPLDLPGAYFEPGHPTRYETLQDGLDPEHAAESMENLRTTADRLAKFPGVNFEVAGHADSAECEGAECRYLSLRRAQLVFRHLLKLGVDPERLDSLYGWGAGAAISEAQSEESWRNRRVDINVSN